MTPESDAIRSIPRAAAGSPSGGAPTALDIAIIWLFVAAVIAVAAHAPSDTYANAQLQQVGAVVGTVDSGEWLLPRDQFDGLARKPQLYAWLDAAVLWLTDRYNDFTFRLPTVLASFATAAMVYLLGRRWYSRRVGLLAGVLWATALHMSKLTYVAVTDMLFTAFVTASILCADRLLFHPAPRGRRLGWVFGLWAAMILAALSKGWGVANLILVGLFLAMATGLRPGFAAAGGGGGPLRALGRACRIVVGRWSNAVRRTHLGWGLLAMAAVLTPVWIGMFHVGGEEFARIVRFEFWARITGEGEIAPHSRSTPAVANLVYYTLPASAYAIAALMLVLPPSFSAWRPIVAGRRLLAALVAIVRELARRWLGRRSPVSLPLWWIVAVTLPFSLTHGFRPDYLLPCYAAVALIAAWGVDAVGRRVAEEETHARIIRHVCGAGPVVIGMVCIVLPTAYFLHNRLPESLRESLEMPVVFDPLTWWLAGATIALGAVVMSGGVVASLKLRMRTVAVLAAAGMLGVLLMETHFVSRHARTGDGERMWRFAREAREVVGDDAFAVYEAEKLAAELYFGRFGRRVTKEEDFVARLNAMDAPWLVTCDKGLVQAGMAVTDRDGGYRFRVRVDGKRRRMSFDPRPDDVGDVRLMTGPIQSQGWGRIYLIRIRRPVERSGEPVDVPFISGKRD